MVNSAITTIICNANIIQALSPEAIDSLCRPTEIERKERDNLSPAQMTLPQLEQRVAELALSSLRTLCADAYHRKLNALKNPELLKTGVYYANDYYLLLKQLGRVNEIEKLKKSGAFFHGLAPSQYFDIKKSTNPNCYTGHVLMGYTIKEGVKASDALKAVFEELVFLDCQEACFVAYYAVLLEILGAEKFDLLFDAASETPLNLCSNDTANPLFILLQNPQRFSFPLSDKYLGKKFYVYGVPAYTFKHLNGEARGFNLFYLEAKKFLGLGLNPDGVTAGEITEELVAAYNQRPIDAEVVTQAVFKKITACFNSRQAAQYKALSTHQTTKQQRFDIDSQGTEPTLQVGEFCSAFDGLDAGKIYALLRASKENAVKLMRVWKRQLEEARALNG
jgi:hypothetical protein